MQGQEKLQPGDSDVGGVRPTFNWHIYVYSQTERHLLQQKINRLRTIGISVMNDQPSVNQQQLAHVSNSSNAQSPVSDFPGLLIDSDEGAVDCAPEAMIPQANTLHAQHYSHEQSVSTLSSHHDFFLDDDPYN